jgi:hypothetical protein
MSYRTISVTRDQGIVRLKPTSSSDRSAAVKWRALTNLALNKPAVQSSEGAPAGRAVDGNTEGAFDRKSVTHTLAEPNAWWQIDLGRTAKISGIVIWNRTDCCSERLKDFWVFVSDVPFGPSDSPANLQKRPGSWSGFFDEIPSPTIEVDVGATAGRYVRIQLQGRNPLSLAEVQVFGVATE